MPFYQSPRGASGGREQRVCHWRNMQPNVLVDRKQAPSLVAWQAN